MVAEVCGPGQAIIIEQTFLLHKSAFSDRNWDFGSPQLGDIWTPAETFQYIETFVIGNYTNGDPALVASLFKILSSCWYFGTLNAKFSFDIIWDKEI